MAVAQTFLQLSYVVGNLGIGTAVVQARHLSPDECRGATTISMTAALILTLCCAAAAPWAALFFSMPVLRLAIPIMAMQVLLSGAAVTPLALLRRELQYGRIAMIEVGAGLVYALVSIGLAMTGHGLWSLVWTPLVSGVWTMGAAHIVAQYRPGLCFDRLVIRRLVGFGGTLTLKNVFVHIARHSDNLVVAKCLGDSATGLYTRAFSVSTLPQTRLVSIVYSVSFPIFCRLRDDAERFHGWYLRATSAAAVVVAPILMGICALAPDFTVTVYGDRWAGMATSLRILSIAGLITCMHMLGGAAIEASGRLRYEVAAQSLYGIMILIGAMIGVRFGIEGVSTAVLIAALVFYFAKALALKKAIGLEMRHYVGATAPALASGLIMSLAVVGVVRALPASGTAGFWALPALRLLIGALVGAVVYAVVIFVVGRRHIGFIYDQAMLFLGRNEDDRQQSVRAKPQLGTTSS